MTIGEIPAAEVRIDVPLVRALLREQHADLAGLPLRDFGGGWDNALYRLGDAFIVRLPRRAIAAPLIEHEQRWLPELAPGLPLPVPVPVRIGRSGCGFPWSWSIVPWLDGENAAAAPLRNAEHVVVQLADVLRALHQPAPEGAPHNPLRGVPLAARAGKIHERLAQLESIVDREAVLALWQVALQAKPWPGPPLWIHGDLHPGNLLVADGRLSAVLDFGDLTAGDPATDLSIAWTLLPRESRPRLRTLVSEANGALDADTWRRARGWALVFGLTFLSASRSSEMMRMLGQQTLEAVLDEDA